MDELTTLIDAILSQIASKAGTKESLEWYLQNNLVDYKLTILNAATPHEIENATRALMRFCTESMDWDNPLYRTCCELTDLGLKFSKRFP